MPRIRLWAANRQAKQGCQGQDENHYHNVGRCAPVADNQNLVTAGERDFALTARPGNRPRFATKTTRYQVLGEKHGRKD